MNKQEVKEKYASEPWGKLLRRMGWEPYDTESRARDVARFAADENEQMLKVIKDLATILQLISLEEWDDMDPDDGLHEKSARKLARITFENLMQRNIIRETEGMSKC